MMTREPTEGAHEGEPQGALVRMAFFGSSLVSAYWNGAATYYRGLLKALAAHGIRTTFFEPDAYDRQAHRDIADPPWAKVEVYPASEQALRRALQQAKKFEVVVKASGVGIFDDVLEREVLTLAGPGRLVAFWDVDAPATLERLRRHPADPFHALLPRYDAIFTCGGGAPVVAAYRALGAQTCLPIYNALDPQTHHPAPPDPLFGCALAFLGNRLPDREARVEEFFLSVARRRPHRRFLLGGSGWNPEVLPDNVVYVGHVYTEDHNTLNASALAVLNLHRDSMARTGHSPTARLFEAAGAASCIITDASEGIDGFLEPGHEILVARNGFEVGKHLDELTASRAAAIGAAAVRRILADHTYAHRAETFKRALDGLRPGPARRGSSNPAGRREEARS